jgi:hypothetical protein
MLKPVVAYAGAFAFALSMIGCGGERPSATAPTAVTAATAPASAAFTTLVLTTNSAGALFGGQTGVRPPSDPGSDLDAAAAALTVPGAPTGLSASVSGTTVILSWNAPTAGDPVTTYLICGGSGSGQCNLAANTPTGGIAQVFAANNLPAGTYYVRLSAQNAGGVSGFSNEVVFTIAGPSGPCVTPGVPGNLAIASNANGTVTFTWNSAPGSPTSYVLEAGSAPGQSNLASSDIGGATSFTMHSVPSSVYHVRVRGRNACGTGPASNEVVLTVIPASPVLTYTPLVPIPGVAGAPYFFSFCGAAITGNGGNCDAAQGPGAGIVGGQPPYHFDLDVGGNFPPIGLILAPNGVLSGTPSASGNRVFRICAIDVAGHFECKPVSITIAPAGPAGCTSAPPTPGSLTSSVSGSTVTLNWGASAGATSYVVEAGSSSGASNLVVTDTGSTGTTMSAPVGNGSYYVRVKAKNACGTSGATTETKFVVGSTPTPTPTPTPQPGAGIVRVNTFLLNACEAMPPASGLPGFRNCTGTVSATVTKIVTSGYVSIFFAYTPGGGSFYHGEVRVTPGAAPGDIVIPVRMEYAPACVSPPTLTMTLRDGPQSANTAPVLATLVVGFRSACS